MVPAQVRDLLIQLETGILAAQTRGDVDFIAGLLADEFVEIGSSGVVYSKADVLRAIAASPMAEYSLDQFNLLAAGACVIVTYLARTRRVNNAELRQSRRSSTWIERGGRWQVLFHQGTPMPPECSTAGG
jgi:hypothetical protein